MQDGFAGTIRLAADPNAITAVMRVDDRRLTIRVNEQLIGDWPINDTEFVPMGSAVLVHLDQERVELRPDDPTAFMEAIQAEQSRRKGRSRRAGKRAKAGKDKPATQQVETNAKQDRASRRSRRSRRRSDEPDEGILPTQPAASNVREPIRGVPWNGQQSAPASHEPAPTWTDHSAPQPMAPPEPAPTDIDREPLDAAAALANPDAPPSLDDPVPHRTLPPVAAPVDPAAPVSNGHSHMPPPGQPLPPQSNAPHPQAVPPHGLPPLDPISGPAEHVPHDMNEPVDLDRIAREHRGRWADATSNHVDPQSRSPIADDRGIELVRGSDAAEPPILATPITERAAIEEPPPILAAPEIHREPPRPKTSIADGLVTSLDDIDEPVVVKPTLRDRLAERWFDIPLKFRRIGVAVVVVGLLGVLAPAILSTILLIAGLVALFMGGIGMLEPVFLRKLPPALDEQALLIIGGGLLATGMLLQVIF